MDKKFSTIKIRKDKSCEMAEVYLDDTYIMGGNFWDFHSGCHNIYKYGEFEDLNELRYNLQIYQELKGFLVEVIEEEYSWEEEQ
jgi:hypothetical protein